MRLSYCTILILILGACQDESDFSPSNLSQVINLIVEDNEAVADGYSPIKVIAEFPINFNTEDDDTVDFIIQGDNMELIESKAIRFLEKNGENKKQADISIFSTSVQELMVKGIISINGSEISKETTITFKRALCDKINITASSLQIKPDSTFGEIIISTKLTRASGQVSIGTETKTFVIDTLGSTRGQLVDYKALTDSAGVVTNRFTMGNDKYIGELLVISESLGASNKIKADTLVIYSQR